jgi:hypothetical protein
VADSSVKKRRDEPERVESPPARQNGSEEKRKSSSDRKRFEKYSLFYILKLIYLGECR